MNRRDSMPSRWSTGASALPEQLNDLAGPAAGMVRLPPDLAWSGRTLFDLGDPGQLYLCYMTVLTAAIKREHYTRWLNADLLMTEWEHLRLPRPLRRLWHERFPELATAYAHPA
ncbi:hypothetical protein GCM10009530_27790 [Microbispora corallina]|uniref:Transcriptional regulator n=1 Tax=Microbispora corallina TaxID=83302 RepID=A0ABQ4FZC3_9ACTN|nr:hypothetical protein [Microbispora corallina]GIH40164.1 hypothetical protein Mco01_31640 [Microbispora corallina]